MAGGRHRINYDGCLPSLKLVYGSDTTPGNSFLEFEHLRVVRRDDQDVGPRDPPFDIVSVKPSRVGAEDFMNNVADAVRLFW